MRDHLTASKKATYKAFKSFLNSNSFTFIKPFNTLFSTFNFVSNRASTSIDATNSYPLFYNPQTKAAEGYNSKAKS